MAYKVLPTKQACFDFFKTLESLGYRQLTNQEIFEELKEKETVSTVVQKGKGYGFKRQYVRQVGVLRSRVVTNYSDAKGCVDENKVGRVFVEDTRSEVSLISSDIVLTEGYLSRMTDYAEAFADIVDNYPYDPGCDNMLMLDHIPGVMNEMYFTCKTKEPKHVHRDRRVEIYFLDIPISDKNKHFLKRMFDPYTKRVDKQKAEGKLSTPRRKTRSDKNIPRSSDVPDQTNSVKNQKGIHHEVNQYTDTEANYDHPQ